jgi:hypothetical protein
MSASAKQNIETIHAMRRQEELAYSVVDYLSYLPMTTTALDTHVDASCRFIMSKWCNEIADFCNYKRETVAIAMNCLDRFMSTPSGNKILLDRNMYQLAAMTALYSSVKIHEQEAMDPNLVSSLSRGVHSAQAVEAMESKMLTAIQWRVNPPTAMSFVRSMIDLVPDHLMHSCQKETVVDIAKLQIEMIVNEYDFCTVNASSVAFACALNAMESVMDDGMLYTNFETTMGKTIMVDDSCVRDLRIAIYELMNGSDDTNNIRMNSKSYSTKTTSSFTGPVATQDNNIHSSPRTVATSVAQR